MLSFGGLLLPPREPQRIEAAHRLHVEERRGLGVGHDGLAGEALDQRPRHPGVDRRDQPDPQRRQVRREEREGELRAAPLSGFDRRK